MVSSLASPLLKLPETRQERWALLAQLIAHWYAPLTQADGYTDEELKQCASRLGIILPPALQEWYRLAGKRRDVWCQQDTLLAPADMFTEKGVLHFSVENQGVTYWGIRLGDLSEENPPVVVLDQFDEWVVQSPLLSEFVLHLFAFLVRFAARTPRIYGYAGSSCVERIIGAIPALGFTEFVWTGARLFGFRDLIVSIDSTNHVSASGCSLETLAPFRQLIKGSDFDVISQTEV